MKKLAALSLTVALCLGMFSACSGGGTSSVANSGSASTADSQGSGETHYTDIPVHRRHSARTGRGHQ